jgi:hypothetical protein
LENAIQNEMAQRGDPFSGAASLEGLSSPHQVANQDPALGGDQVRYQASMFNEATGEWSSWSVNYDPQTGQFGTNEPVSWR